jgi:hypothetical protein
LRITELLILCVKQPPNENQLTPTTMEMEDITTFFLWYNVDSVWQPRACLFDATKTSWQGPSNAWKGVGTPTFWSVEQVQLVLGTINFHHTMECTSLFCSISHLTSLPPQFDHLTPTSLYRACKSGWLRFA